MPALLYARVSTGQQAERDLSIPAQLHALRRYAQENKLIVAGEYQDIGSARGLKHRPGLTAAVNRACHDLSIDTMCVHKVDRLSRSTYNYLTLKGKLKSHGVRIVSVVERIDATPMGEFLEHFMAAQAEYYSANLSFEVRKGQQERLRRGKWIGRLPLGYRKEGERAVFDEARAPQLRYAFERWAAGDISSYALSDELYERGLVSRSGKRIRANSLCRILQTPFYVGRLGRDGKLRGTHPSLVSDELYERAQEVFRQKRGPGKTRRSLTFVLARKVRCPRCAALLVGEEHTKPSGKVYRYYRCHRKQCSFSRRGGELDAQVCEQLLVSAPWTSIIPVLQQRIADAQHRHADEVGARLDRFEEQQLQLKQEQRNLVARWRQETVASDAFERQLSESKLAAELLTWQASQLQTGAVFSSGDVELLQRAERFAQLLISTDPIDRRRAVDDLVERVGVIDPEPDIVLAEPWATLAAAPSSKSYESGIVVH